MGIGMSTLMHSDMHANPSDLEAGSTELGLMPGGRPINPSVGEDNENNAFMQHLQGNGHLNDTQAPTSLTHLNQSYMTSTSNTVAGNNHPINLNANHGDFRVDANNSEIDSRINHGSILVSNNNNRFSSTSNYGKVDVTNNNHNMSLFENHGNVALGSNASSGVMTSENTAAGATEHVTENNGKMNIENSNGSHFIEHNKAGTITVGPLGPHGSVHIPQQNGTVIQKFDPSSALGKKYPNGLTYNKTGTNLALNNHGRADYWNPRAFIKESPAKATAAYGGTTFASVVGAANAPSVISGIPNAINIIKTLHGG